MASDVVPNGIKIEWNGIQNSIPVVNRVYVTMATAPTAGDLVTAYDTALDFWTATRVMHHPSFTLQNITVTDVSVANGNQEITPITTDNVGTAAGAAAAANAALCVSLRTAQIGRSFRGRFYFGALGADDQQDAQNWQTTLTSFAAGAFQDFIDALAAVNMTLVVVSRFVAGVARIVNLATEIISVIVDTKIDSQRRRTAN